MPDFNNGPRNDLNSSCSLNTRRLFESDSNNGTPQAIPMLNCKHESPKANIKYNLTTIKQALDALAVNRSLFTDFANATVSQHE